MIGILSAMDHEVDNLINSGKILKTKVFFGINFYILKIFDKKIVVCKSGIGKVNASITTTLLLSKFKIDYVINSGIVGGISPLKTDDLLIIDSFEYSDVDLTCFNYKHGQIPKIPHILKPDNLLLEKVIEVFNKKGYTFKKAHLLTGDTFMKSKSNIKNDIVNIDYIATDMEAQAIAHTCYLNNTKIVSIKYVSDILDEESQIKNYNLFEIEKANMSCVILKELIKNL